MAQNLPKLFWGYLKGTGPRKKSLQLKRLVKQPMGVGLMALFGRRAGSRITIDR
jgi:hypothetical protein